MLAILFQTTDLKEKLYSSYCVQIMAVISNDTVNKALLNIWKTDEYKSMEQVIVCFKGA